jgi:biotin-[acetyl-CoA-carboxylase] ligase BirA-like protein
MKRFLVQSKNAQLFSHEQSIVTHTGIDAPYSAEVNRFASSISKSTIFSHILSSDAEPSTQTSVRDLLKSSAEYPGGMIYITKNQTNGRGRLQNVWIGGESTLCFTYAFSLSQLAPNIRADSVFKQLPYLPYLNSVCAYLALENQEGVQLKWPNDIYGGFKECGYRKMGGNLCESEQMFDQTIAICGLGINFEKAPSNDFSCVNEIAQGVSREEFLIRFFDHFHNYAEMLSTKTGRKEIANMVTKNWMHQDQEMTVKSDKVSPEPFKGKITGISESGFLQVTSGSKVHEVYPEHSLDLSSNTIV